MVDSYDQGDAGFVQGQGQDFSISIKIRDLEEKQRLLKDRILLIGENLIGFRDDTYKILSELKSSISHMEEDLERIKDVVQRLSEEIDEKARKTDIEILKKQAKMFDPLNLATIKDVKEIIRGEK